MNEWPLGCHQESNKAVVLEETYIINECCQYCWKSKMFSNIKFLERISSLESKKQYIKVVITLSYKKLSLFKTYSDFFQFQKVFCFC